jgi:hypothetical protein
MPDLSPLSGGKQKSDFATVRAAFDPTATLAVRCRNDSEATPIDVLT